MRSLIARTEQAVGPPTLLIVDDLEANRVALAALLAEPGRVVLEAADGRQALEILLDRDVSVALLDVRMPGMDGLELASAIRATARLRELPILFVSAGGGDPARIGSAYATGAVDFVEKPIDPVVLRAKVEVFLRLDRQRRQLMHQVEALTRVIEVNEAFVGILGHDLRDPLSAIIGGSRVLQRLAPEGEPQTAASRIHSNALRMGRMIDQLLDLARIRAGRVELSLQDTDLAELATAVVDERGVDPADRRRLRVERDGDCRGCWDPDRLSQVIANLVGNALRHGVPGGPVTLSLDGTDPDAVALAVHNDGTIPADVLPGVFDPFKRGFDRPSAGESGLGLGLHIVSQWVQLHQGRVAVESTAGQGTRFEVFLPRHSRHDPAAANRVFGQSA